MSTWTMLAPEPLPVAALTEREARTAWLYPGAAWRAGEEWRRKTSLGRRTLADDQLHDLAITAMTAAATAKWALRVVARAKVSPEEPAATVWANGEYTLCSVADLTTYLQQMDRLTDAEYAALPGGWPLVTEASEMLLNAVRRLAGDKMDVQRLLDDCMPPQCRPMPPNPFELLVAARPPYYHRPVIDGADVAFHDTADKFRRGLRVKMKIRRYIQAHLGVSEPAKIDEIARLVKDPYELRWAETGAHIAEVYDEVESYSCMAGKFEDVKHPARIYGSHTRKDGTVIETDFKLAYLYCHRTQKAVGRSIVSKLTRKFVRVYGPTTGGEVEKALTAMLKKEGFIKAEWYGDPDHRQHRIRRVWVDRDVTLVMPYVDGEKAFDLGEDDRYVIVRDNGEYEITIERTDGTFPLEECGRVMCRHCDERFDEDDGRYIHDEFVCDSCCSDHYDFCNQCDEYVDAGDTEEVITYIQLRAGREPITRTSSMCCDCRSGSTFECEGFESLVLEADRNVYQAADARRLRERIDTEHGGTYSRAWFIHIGGVTIGENHYVPDDYKQGDGTWADSMPAELREHLGLDETDETEPSVIVPEGFEEQAAQPATEGA